MVAAKQARQRGPYEAAVLRILRDGGPTSRSKLSSITGLSATTITKAVAPLIELGLLTEQAVEYSGPGRPALALTPVPEALTVCGVQIGVGRICIGLSDGQLRVRKTHAYAFDPALGPNEVLDGIAAEVQGLLAQDSGTCCLGVGVGAPGPVNLARRTNLLSINLGWRDVPVSDLLELRLGVPVVVDHNVRSFALAEARYGAHQAESLAYLYVRTGVGLGVVVRGAPFYGGPGPGGESYLGHTRVVQKGRLCACGARGCLDTVVSEPYLAAQLEAIRGSANPGTPDVMRELHQLAADGHVAARALERSVIGHLASALATVVNLFTPEVVLGGGILSAAPSTFITRLRDQTRDRIFPLLRDSLRIEAADGGDEALVRGAAAIALEVLHYS